MKFVPACNNIPPMPPIQRRDVYGNLVVEPQVVYPADFVGPIPHNAVRAPSNRQPTRPAPARPILGPPSNYKPPAPTPNQTYTKRDGSICNKGGGLCAI
jgi:hypothetical protein